MAVSNSYLTFVLEQLEGVPHVVTRRMFGGVGIYSGGTFFAVVDNDTLFFKVDDTLRPRYVERGMPAFQPMPGKAAMTGYYQVPTEVLEDADALARWAKESIGVALKGPRAQRSKGPRVRC